MFENTVFSKLANKNIFSNDFKIFNENNELSFSEEGICVVYGPNGTSKTSLINTLSKQPGTEFSFSFRDKTYTNESKESVVFVINDQNNRNIISGGTQDFLLGDNIKREYELKQELEDAYGKIVTSLVNDIITPLIGIIIGGLDFSNLILQIGKSKIAYGSFIQTVIDFLIIAICIFTVVKLFEKLKHEQKKEEKPKKTDEVVLLEEIRDLLKKQVD